MTDYARYVMPSSYAVYNAAKKSIDIALNSDDGNDLFICMACGGPDDLAYKGAVQTAQKLPGDERIHFGTDFQKDNLIDHADNILRVHSNRQRDPPDPDGPLLPVQRLPLRPVP